MTKFVTKIYTGYHVITYSISSSSFIRVYGALNSGWLIFEIITLLFTKLHCVLLCHKSMFNQLQCACVVILLSSQCYMILNNACHLKSILPSEAQLHRHVMKYSDGSIAVSTICLEITSPVKWSGKIWDMLIC